MNDDRKKLDKVTPIFSGTVTIENPDTGNHRTFKIYRRKADAKFAPGRRILSLLSGSDNESDYRGFAFVNKDGSIRVWKRCRGNGKPSKYEIYADMVRSLAGGFRSSFRSDNWVGMKMHHSGTCFRCNRKLTVPESLQTGLGPECRKMMGV